MKKILLFLTIILIPFNVFAEDITKTSKITINDTEISKLKDNNENTYIELNKDNSIKITNDIDIYGIYIIYEMSSVKGIISNYTREIEIGTNGYLHEYINVNKLIGYSKELELSFNDNVKIGEIYVLSKGSLPDYVEVWDKPCNNADLLLFSTHSDDEQLFFAGLMPTYVAKGKCVQVTYFTNHFDNPKRLHEQIHGLYKVGIRNYPVISNIPDAWSDTLKWAKENLKKAGLSGDDALKYQVEMIRRFKPQVIVGHDENGEYSHGQHILNTYLLKDAIIKANDKDYDLNSYNKYGLWDTPKVYLHLYNENKIIMDYDTPLDYFNGLTAYEVSKLGYKEHNSQQYTWFTKWLTGVDSRGNGNPYTKITEIKKYSPCEFGLYRSLVGEDINKNDMFENIVTKKEENNNNVINTIKNDINNKEISIKEYTTYIYFGIVILTSLIVIIKTKNK